MKLNMIKAFDILDQRTPKIIETAWLINTFMSGLDNAYRAETHVSGMRGNNYITWFQYFLNGAWLEYELRVLNPGLRFKEAGHGIIDNEVSGRNIPDFEFTYAGENYTLESKTFYNLQKFNNATHFENADFCIAFIMDERKFYFREKVDGGYRQAINIDDVPECYPALVPYLGWIQLPKTVKMIGFDLDKNTFNRDVPESVTYKIYNYKVRNKASLRLSAKAV